MIWLVTKALNMSIGPQNRLFRVPFWPKRTLKCKITSKNPHRIICIPNLNVCVQWAPLERIFDFTAAYFDMVRASGQVLLMKATLWLPITLYGTPCAPYGLLWTHYGTIWNPMSLFVPIWALYVLLCAPYSHLWALYGTLCLSMGTLWPLLLSGYT